MRLVKSNLRKKENNKFERVLETSTNIYFFCFGKMDMFAQKYDRKMNLISEGIGIDNEIIDILKEKNYSWISKKFEKTFAELI
jgi:hypothetical protein